MLIKLEDTEGNICLVNTDKIESVNYKGEKRTRVFFCNGYNTEVKQSPNEIYQIIKYMK